MTRTTPTFTAPPVRPCYVRTESGVYLAQLPDPDAYGGFILADDEQTWEGGLGWGSWEAVSPHDVPDEDRERLGWLIAQHTTDPEVFADPRPAHAIIADTYPASQWLASLAKLHPEEGATLAEVLLVVGEDDLPPGSPLERAYVDALSTLLATEGLTLEDL